MMQIFFGRRGSGKTKVMIDLANKNAKESTGNVVFVHSGGRCMLDLHHKVRYVNASEYHIVNPQQLYGFICGLLAANYDIQEIYLVGFTALAGTEDVVQLAPALNNIELLSNQQNIKVYLTLSSNSDVVPEEFKKYVQ